VPTHVVLGRSAGLTEVKLAHLADDPPPPGVYSDEEALIVRYAQSSTGMQRIDDDLYGRLSEFLSRRQLIELCFTVGLANLINRFHATFHTDVDRTTSEELGGSSPLPLPEPPGAQPADHG
jgi:alkylhydroperoxidase family enzyme